MNSLEVNGCIAVDCTLTGVCQFDPTGNKSNNQKSIPQLFKYQMLFPEVNPGKCQHTTAWVMLRCCSGRRQFAELN